MIKKNKIKDDLNQRYVNEKVIKNSFKKVYNYNDINKWINYGLKNNLINMNDKKSVYDWVSVLQKINFEL